MGLFSRFRAGLGQSRTSLPGDDRPRFSRQELDTMPPRDLERLYYERRQAENEPDLRERRRLAGDADWASADYHTLLRRSVDDHNHTRNLEEARRLGIAGVESMSPDQLFGVVISAKARRNRLDELAQAGHPRPELERLSDREVERLFSDRQRAVREPELREERRRLGDADWESADYYTLLQRSVDAHNHARNLEEAQRLGIEGAAEMSDGELFSRVIAERARQGRIDALAGTPKPVEAGAGTREPIAPARGRLGPSA